MPAAKNTKVVLVDDHNLVRKGMVELINDFLHYSVVWEAENGRDFIQKLVPQDLPDIVLLDINMPVMDGFETAQWMEQRYPEVKILAISMYKDEETILRMLKSGVNGYVLKNVDPSELKNALDALVEKGFYYTDQVMKITINNIHKKQSVTLTDREIEFLKLACTEYPYKSFPLFMTEEISARTVEDCRDRLFKKLGVVSRVGLVIYAIKHKIFKIE